MLSGFWTLPSALRVLDVTEWTLASGPPGPQKSFTRASVVLPGRLFRACPLRYQVDATKYLVELFGIDELEKFRREVQLVGRPDLKRQCDDFGSV
eukprot:645956-Pyramimonas_sp.AAC.1